MLIILSSMLQGVRGITERERVGVDLVSARSCSDFSVKDRAYRFSFLHFLISKLLVVAVIDCIWLQVLKLGSGGGASSMRIVLRSSIASFSSSSSSQVATSTLGFAFRGFFPSSRVWIRSSPRHCKLFQTLLF